MFKYLVVAMYLFGAVANRPADTKTNESKPTEWAQKAFRFDGQSVAGHDFGAVPAGAQLSHSFKIKNVWKVPLQIQASVSSDSVKVKLPKKVLQKNEEGTIDIDMDCRRFIGAKNVNVFVTLREDDTRPRYQSSTTLRIVATTPAPLIPAKAANQVKPPAVAVPPVAAPAPIAVLVLAPAAPACACTCSVRYVPRCDPCPRLRCCRRRCH